MTETLHVPMRRRAIGLLSAGHLITDMTQGALPALLPVLYAARGLNYTKAGGLMLALSVTSAAVQPLFGHFADRIAKPWLMPMGVLLTGLGMALVGVAPHYWMIAAVVAACGLGVAAFHPEAARLANSAAGSQKATGMSIFSGGGNIGFALGPVLAAVTMLIGLQGTVLIALPCLLMAIILFAQLGQFAAPPHAIAHALTAPAGRDAWGPFAWLSIAVIARSIIFYGFITFLPLYWSHVLHRPQGASLPLTLLFAVGAVGTVIGGRLADRLGYKRIMSLGFGLSIPLMLVLIGLTFYLPFSAMVVVGQQYLPNRVGLSSGVTLGLSVSIGGLVAPLLGKLADLHGLHAALTVVALLPILALGVVATLPKVQALPPAEEPRAGMPPPPYAPAEAE